MQSINNSPTRQAAHQTTEATNERGVPLRFMDPCSGEIMLDPVVLHGSNLVVDRHNADAPGLQSPTVTAGPAPQVYAEAPALRSEIESFVNAHPHFGPQLTQRGLAIVDALSEAGLSRHRSHVLWRQAASHFEADVMDAMDLNELAEAVMNLHFQSPTQASSAPPAPAAAQARMAARAGEAALVPGRVPGRVPRAPSPVRYTPPAPRTRYRSPDRANYGRFSGG